MHILKWSLIRQHWLFWDRTYLAQGFSTVSTFSSASLHGSTFFCSTSSDECFSLLPPNSAEGRLCAWGRSLVNDEKRRNIEREKVETYKIWLASEVGFHMFSSFYCLVSNFCTIFSSLLSECSLQTSVFLWFEHFRCFSFSHADLKIKSVKCPYIVKFRWHHTKTDENRLLLVDKFAEFCQNRSSSQNPIFPFSYHSFQTDPQARIAGNPRYLLDASVFCRNFKTICRTSAVIGMKK